MTQTALGVFVCFIKKRELRHRRFRSIPRNPISCVNTMDFPHNPDLIRTGASVKNWRQTDTWVRRPVGVQACERRTLHFLLTLAVFPRIYRWADNEQLNSRPGGSKSLGVSQTAGEN